MKSCANINNVSKEEKKNSKIRSHTNLVNIYDTFMATFTFIFFFLLRAKRNSRECLSERNSELNLKEACS